MLLAIHIEKEETTKGYYKLLTKVFSKYGFPSIIKTDRRRTFWGSQTTQTLMHESLQNLNIELFCDSSPTFKPNVERSFSNAQKLYPLLFYKKKINDNETIFKDHDWLVEKYNKRFNKKPIANSLFNEVDLESIKTYMCPKQKVRINNAMFVTFQGKPLAPVNKKGLRQALKSGGYLTIHMIPETDELFTMHNNQKMKLVEVDGNLIFEGELYEIKKQRDALERKQTIMATKNREINRILEKKKADLERLIEIAKRYDINVDEV